MTKEQLDGLRIKFWDQLLDKAKEDGKTSITGRNNKGDPDPHKKFYPFKPSKLHYLRCFLRKDHIFVEVYINPGDSNINERYLQQLKLDKDSIEKDLSPLVWLSPKGQITTARIQYYITEGGLNDIDKWPYLHKRIIEVVHKMEQMFKHRLEGISL